MSQETNPPPAKFHSLMTWPVGNILTLLGLDKYPEGTHFIPPPAIPFGKPMDHVRTCLGSVRSFLLAYFIMFYIHGGKNYPAFGTAVEWNLSWMWPIFLRNFLGAWIICGTWDYILYYSSLAPAFKPFKICQKYPIFKQMKHDAFWSTIGTICGSILEVVYCHGAANKTFSMHQTIGEAPVKHIIWILFMTHIREPHDYLRHRLFHPWRLSWFPDIGRFLYKHIHRLHHKSYNTTAFSGLSFHPIEATIYLSANFLAVPFGVHPVIPLALLIDCGFAAWLGHGGFVFPGTGDYYHSIHHFMFDCNYGTQNIGLDWLFGTFAAREEDAKKIWSKRKIGLADNNTNIFTNRNEKKGG